MKKLLDKDEILFSVLWIVVYVVGFSLSDGLSSLLGMEKLITVIFGLAMTAVLLIFFAKHGLLRRFGLQAYQGSYKKAMFFLPLGVITFALLPLGFRSELPVTQTVLSVTAMCLAGFLEEIIFRGMLFQGMKKNSLTLALLVSSLTFGAGHAVNLLMGGELLPTLIQMGYATAVGFCYTALFYRGKSLFPCMISHMLVNGLSVVLAEPGLWWLLAIGAVQSVVSVCYGLWLLWKAAAKDRKTEVRHEKYY